MRGTEQKPTCPGFIFKSIGIASDLFCCWFYVELRHDFVLLTKQLKRCVIRIFKLKTKNKVLSCCLVFFVCSYNASPACFRDYAAIVFFANNRFETGKRKLQYLTFQDFAFCAGQLINNWTVGAVGEQMYFFLFPLADSCDFFYFYLRCKGACTTF